MRYSTLTISMVNAAIRGCEAYRSKANGAATDPLEVTLYMNPSSGSTYMLTIVRSSGEDKDTVLILFDKDLSADLDLVDNRVTAFQPSAAGRKIIRHTWGAEPLATLAAQLLGKALKAMEEIP